MGLLPALDRHMLATQRTETPKVPHQPLIACVDDDTSVREALEGLLRAFGFTVATFASAEAFLGFERMADVSCLITDVKLGGMSGLELLRRLNSSPEPIPTIVVTAFSDESMREEARHAGAVDLLPKPIAPERLLDAVRRALARRSAS